MSSISTLVNPIISLRNSASFKINFAHSIHHKTTTEKHAISTVATGALDSLLANFRIRRPFRRVGRFRNVEEMQKQSHEEEVAHRVQDSEQVYNEEDAFFFSDEDRSTCQSPVSSITSCDESSSDEEFMSEARFNFDKVVISAADLPSVANERPPRRSFRRVPCFRNEEEMKKQLQGFYSTEASTIGQAVSADDDFFLDDDEEVPAYKSAVTEAASDDEFVFGAEFSHTINVSDGEEHDFTTEGDSSDDLKNTRATSEPS
ncbi:hypothetical protein BDW22DRAFT_1364355 [Trametopsis cervina]|nr:hypothetical protein BDW22DRAFT_1364355 [Trametopsis cervina]